MPRCLSLSPPSHSLTSVLSVSNPTRCAMKCKEFTAWIEIDGQPIPEYAFMRIGTSVECYIESIPEKVRNVRLIFEARLICPSRTSSSIGRAIVKIFSHLDTFSSMAVHAPVVSCKECRLPIALPREQAQILRDHSPSCERLSKVKSVWYRRLHLSAHTSCIRSGHRRRSTSSWDDPAEDYAV